MTTESICPKCGGMGFVIVEGVKTKVQEFLPGRGR